METYINVHIVLVHAAEEQSMEGGAAKGGT